MLGSTFAILAFAAASGARAQSATQSAGASIMTSSTNLKLAKTYSGSSFTSDFTFFTGDDPTDGYVNYVSLADATSQALVDVQSDGSFIMRADSTNIATGRGRNSVRISSNDQWADGVYILDLNHMPVGCGTWPAFWTVVENGWPKGGEIDIIEGANAIPTPHSAAYNATTGLTNATQSGYPINYDVASLHTSDNCKIDDSAYMTGVVSSQTCSAYLNGNTGCGVDLGTNATYGTDSFGAGVNSIGGGWYAMWRDIANSGGVYIYFWPRTSTSVPQDVKDSTSTSTNVADWGQPGANLSVPTCKGDFGNHVIVFDLTFCGQYAGTTAYTASGCPSTCTNFVMNNPAAFAEAYWSINSLRVYTATGSPVSTMVLSKGAIAGIVVGGVALIVFIYLLYRRARYTRQRRLMIQQAKLKEQHQSQIPPNQPYTFVAKEDYIGRSRGSLVTDNIPALIYTPYSENSIPRKGSAPTNSWVG